MSTLCKEVNGFKNVRITASVGAGKSTKVPRQLSIETGLPILHVVPSRLLAVHLYDYLSELDSEVEYSLMLEPADVVAKRGVIISYSAAVCSLLLVRGMEAEAPLGKCVMVLDESHESDAYTYVLGKLSHSIPGVVSVISSSATHTADRTPMRETDGEVVAEMFNAADKPSTWDPLDPGKPWSLSALPGNALFFIDSNKDATQLIARYNDAGATAYRLTAHMPVAAFRDAMAALNDPNAGIIVLVADYSFRSGFTLDVQTIVDSSIVQYIDVVDGSTIVKARRAYELERHQAQGRGGRTKGSHCQCFIPDIPAENAICVLEGVEMDAAAVLFRYLGFKVPAEIAVAKMAVGYVPVDFAGVANGAVPLVSLSADSLGTLLRPAPALPEVRLDEASTLEGLIASYTLNSPKEPPVDLFASVVETERVLPELPNSMSGLEFLQQLSQVSAAANSIVVGRYYACPGIPSEDAFSRLYSTNWRLALREVLAKPELVHGFTSSDRDDLVAMMLAEYNKCTAVTAGIQSMLAAQESLQALVVRFPNQVKEWTDYVGGHLRESEATSRSLAMALGYLRNPSVMFVPLDPNIDMENQVAERYASRLKDAIRSVQSSVDAGKYLEYVGKKLDPLSEAPEGQFDEMQVNTRGRRDVVNVRVVPVMVGSRRMQDLVFQVPTGAIWTKEDFRDAVVAYIVRMNFSARVIRSVEFPGSNVSANEVLQEIRDMRELRHRAPREYTVSLKTRSVKGAREKVKAIEGSRK
jgi:hypothetical protein